MLLRFVKLCRPSECRHRALQTDICRALYSNDVFPRAHKNLRSYFAIMMEFSDSDDPVFTGETEEGQSAKGDQENRSPIEQMLPDEQALHEVSATLMEQIRSISEEINRVKQELHSQDG